MSQRENRMSPSCLSGICNSAPAEWAGPSDSYAAQLLVSFSLYPLFPPSLDLFQFQNVSICLFCTTCKGNQSTWNVMKQLCMILLQNIIRKWTNYKAKIFNHIDYAFLYNNNNQLEKYNLKIRTCIMSTSKGFLGMTLARNVYDQHKENYKTERGHRRSNSMTVHSRV